MLIRDAQPGDESAVAEVHVRAWKAAYRGLLPEDFLEELAFGPCRDEDAAGAGELFALYIDPARWRTGAGRALLHAARERLRELGFPEAVLWVLCGNDAAERFYAADGWSRDGSSRWEDPWGVRSQVFRLRRPLR